jgi:uncharacterized surface protein with fasciclin (FAS1) repeats
MRKFLVATVAAAVGAMAIAPSSASAGHEPDRTLADILLADSAGDDENGFDRNWRDYDIVTEAVLLFPDLVDAASNPDADLTVFLPNDWAFRRLVKDLTGERLRSEADVFAAVASLGTDTVKTVLTYHIVPARISYRDALHANNAEIPTLQGETIKVKVRRWFGWFPVVKLVDVDTNDRNPRVNRPNLGGEALNGYAHGINRVLRPVDLP